MDKNIKKLISEAFNELYEEFINEAPSIDTETVPIKDSQIESIIEKALLKGRGFSFNQTTGKDAEHNFNIIIDNLLQTYKESKNENAKKAIQNAFVPNPGGKLTFMLFKSSYGSNDDKTDAISQAYYEVMIKDFEKTIESYTSFDGKFSAFLLTSMKRKMIDLLSRNKKTDAYGGAVGRQSIDKPNEYTGKGIDPANPEEEEKEIGTGGFSDLSTDKQMFIVNKIIELLETNENVSPVDVIIFREILRGAKPKEIWEENPEVNRAFPNYKPITQRFRRFVTSQPIQDASRMLSDILGFKFDIPTEMDPTEFEQISSQNPDFGGFSRTDETSTEEMLDIIGKIRKVFTSLGYTEKSAANKDDFDFNTLDAKITSLKDNDGKPYYDKFKDIFKKMKEKGQESQIKVIESLLRDLAEAKEDAKGRGFYGKKVAYIPKNKDEEDSLGDEFHGMFEGVKKSDVNKLMERVFRRLSK